MVPGAGQRIAYGSPRFAARSKILNCSRHTRRRRTAGMRQGQAAQAAQTDVAQAIAGLQGLRVDVVVSAPAPPPPHCLPAAAALSPAALSPAAVSAASCDRPSRPPLLCRCERQLQLQLSRTPANPDRLFYSCSNRSCHGLLCGTALACTHCTA